ncbi:MAG: hypothetical protein JJ953_14455 [Gracilimonas sp.]|uniref:hypothetical protein n=1 Tax=Gracilimonas TaxID=649462 RepID=UPI001B0C8690|nr:hypothetical protein [Gracilimonas sp.]MBO6587309.1 hypothetical protein [Gracilimonas sp.]MBO6614203.1 hypothetical protein [Gracilimonas sp.]
MQRLTKQFFFFFVMMVMISTAAQAQFEEPDIKKVSKEDRAEFQSRFADIKWTGQGFNYNELDRMPAIEIRAVLQGAYGDPTQKVEDIIEKDGYLRDGKSIQFEYWFIIDGYIPMMVLDLEGPFDDGLVYVGASRYVDLMPQVKRTLTKELRETSPKEYVDYFYSPERGQWYKVSYEAGEYKKEEIKKPSHIKTK